MSQIAIQAIFVIYKALNSYTGRCKCSVYSNLKAQRMHEMCCFLFFFSLSSQSKASMRLERRGLQTVKVQEKGRIRLKMGELRKG